MIWGDVMIMIQHLSKKTNVTTGTLRYYKKSEEVGSIGRNNASFL